MQPLHSPNSTCSQLAPLRAPAKRYSCLTSRIPSPSISTFAVSSARIFWANSTCSSTMRTPCTYLETFAIVTTEPNELVAQIQDRLALILHPRDYDRWLGI